MKILYVLAQAEGGIPHYTAELANAVSEHEDVTVVKPRKSTADDLFREAVTTRDEFESLKISVPKIAKNQINIRDVFQGIMSYNNLENIDQYDPDIVHFTASSELFPVLKIFIRRSNIDVNYPFIETFHTIDPNRWILRPNDIDDFDEGAPVRWLAINNIKNLMARTLPTPNRDHCFVHTEEHKQRLVDRNIHEHDISVVPHGAFEIFNTGRVDVDEEPTTVLFFGNVVSSKGPDTLVKAVPMIKQVIPEVKVIIAGDGVLDKESQNIISNHEGNFEIRNEFIPNEEVEELFQRSSLVSIPHRRLEAQSGTITIAYSFGKPIVTTTIGEFTKQVRDTGAGLVVPPNNPEALANAIITILLNDNIRGMMAENTKIMREQLSWQNIATNHIDIYKTLID